MDCAVTLPSTPAASVIGKNAAGHDTPSTVFAGKHIKTDAVVASQRVISRYLDNRPTRARLQMTSFLGLLEIPTSRTL